MKDSGLVNRQLMREE